MNNQLNDFIKGDPSKQEYYKKGGALKKVEKRNIHAYCQCGYLTLEPTTDFEKFNGGLTVKRAQVRIFDDDKLIKHLHRTNKIQNWHGCNACQNMWL